jgi:hypothetical protein
MPADPIQLLIEGPLAWVPESYFGPGGLAGVNGELARSLGPDGRRLVTLTPLESERRGVHLVEIVGGLARHAAWQAAWPEGWAQTEAAIAAADDRGERAGLLRAYLDRVAWIPLLHWAPAVQDDRGLVIDTGPVPREPREHPCVIKPKRLDWIRAADWRLEALIEQARRGVEPLLEVLELGRAAAPPAGLSGGLGGPPAGAAPALDPELQKLLLDAERARRERELAGRRRRRRRA